MPVSWVSPRHPARGRLFVMLRSSPPPRAGILCEFFAFTHGCRMSQDSPRELLDQLIEQAPDDDERPSKSQLKREMHRSEEHTSELQSRPHLVCRLLLE